MKAIEAAKALGAATAKTPKEVGNACRFVIVAVGYDHEAAAVMLDRDGLLQSAGAGSVIAISSTCTPEHVKMLAEKARTDNRVLLTFDLDFGAILALGVVDRVLFARTHGPI